MSKTLVVTGASGHLGRLVLDHLLERPNIDPARIVAASRDPGKLAGYAEKGVVTRRADFDDPASLETAFAGADTILIVSTDALDAPGRRLRQHRAAIAAAAGSGATHILYTSMPNPEHSVIPFAPDHLQSEEAVKATGIAYTILRNGWYMENLFMALPHALSTGHWNSSAGEGRLAHVARADIAAATAAALVAEPANRTYTLTGAMARTTAEIAALAAAATGKPLAVVPVDDEALAAGLKAAGLPDAIVPVVVSFDTNTRLGLIDMVTGDLSALSGRPAETLESFLAKNAAALS
ncbi:NmrA family NAD(P)-binding protein [Ensifer soli]|uniref:NmrA family NAD(P)-binding protein n=1 Tax=Ciceribacter sp. sgz301302 TaxID=3342379 RepID=UPI0035B89BF2